MKHKNRREVRRCANGEKPMKIRKTALAAAGLAVAGMVAVATPATAAPAHMSYDVVPIHETWHVQEQKPPLETLLRVFELVQVNGTPQQYYDLISLYVYKRVMTKRGLKWEAKRAPNAPAARVGMRDIPTPPAQVTWKFGGPPLFPRWFCKPGRYFIAETGHGVSSTGKADSWHDYSPGSGKQVGGWGSRPPAVDHAIRITKC